MPDLPRLLALAGHGVGPERWGTDRSRLLVSAATLARVIDELRRHGYELVTFSQLVASVADDRGPRRAALTFDDGLADNLDALLPVLERHAAPATTFVVTDWIGGTHPDLPSSRILAETELRQLAEHVEIGTHSCTHTDLRTLDEAEITRELTGSRSWLASAIGRPVTVAACPYGFHDDRVRRLARDLGFGGLATSIGAGTVADPFDVPRVPLRPGMSRLGLRLRADPTWERRLSHPRLRRPIRWRRRLRTRLDRLGTRR